MYVCATICGHAQNSQQNPTWSAQDALGNLASSLEHRKPGKGRLFCLFHKPPCAPQKWGCQLSPLQKAEIPAGVVQLGPPCSGTPQQLPRDPRRRRARAGGARPLCPVRAPEQSARWPLNYGAHIKILAAATEEHLSEVKPLEMPFISIESC